MLPVLWKLYIAFFEIGIFSFGGGYASIPLIKERIVNINQWISPDEMLDLISISQMTPGPVAINSATFVGTKVAGIPGAIIATLGFVTPSFIIISILAWLYYRYRQLKAFESVLNGIRPAVVAMITVASLSILSSVLFFGSDHFLRLTIENIKNVDYIAIGIFVIALFLIVKCKLNSIIVMILSGISGLILYRFI